LLFELDLNNNNNILLKIKEGSISAILGFDNTDLYWDFADDVPGDIVHCRR
jgi:hypothetical protein